jgi:hypothetical protein
VTDDADPLHGIENLDPPALLERAAQVRQGPDHMWPADFYHFGRRLLEFDDAEVFDQGVDLLIASAQCGGPGVHAALELARLAHEKRLRAEDLVETWMLVNWYAEMGDEDAQGWNVKLQTRNMPRD